MPHVEYACGDVHAEILPRIARRGWHIHDIDWKFRVCVLRHARPTTDTRNRDDYCVGRTLALCTCAHTLSTDLPVKCAMVAIRAPGCTQVWQLRDAVCRPQTPTMPHDTMLVMQLLKAHHARTEPMQFVCILMLHDAPEQGSGYQQVEYYAGQHEVKKADIQETLYVKQDCCQYVIL